MNPKTYDHGDLTPWQRMVESGLSPEEFPGTMFGAVYGGGVSHPWLRSAGASREQDHYSMFVMHASVMGWLDEDESPGLWGMNDAGGLLRDAETSSGDPLAWFQIDVNAVAESRPLPVSAFLRCAIDTCQQLQTIEMDKVLLLLPVQRLGLRRIGLLASMRTPTWFDAVDPTQRTKVEIRATVGQSAVEDVLADGIRDFLRQDQHVLTGTARVPGSLSETRPPFYDAFWDGPASMSEVLTGDLVEWSPDAIGWIAQAISECVAARGLVSPMLMTVARVE